MSDLLSIARRFLTAGPGGKGEKGGKPPGGDTFSPISPFPHPGEGGESAPALAGAEPWNPAAALRLVFDADALVERLSIDGRLPAVQAAAAMLVSALAARDMETVRFAAGEFAAAVRAAALQKDPAAPQAT